MDDLINRSELMQAIKRQYCKDCDSYEGLRCRACHADDMLSLVDDVHSVDAIPVVRCKDCVYFKERHVRTSDGQEKSYAEMPTEAFGGLDDMFVTAEYGINVGSQCLVDCDKGYIDDKSVYREPGDFCSRGVRKEEDECQK